MWWPSGWPLIPSRLFSHLHLLVAAQAGLEFVCVFGHDSSPSSAAVKRPRLSNVELRLEEALPFVFLDGLSFQ